ncbi:MAG: hypothetical protein A7316_06850 [Candidatus Altiarchaeales archaeon WOR_SM1_86-2]|nr:MAG: hypothetical protein A7316_06850 [Candidatus Altiarchaeales archaeon WOR_SM1_86-2]ODS39959.1 MAG: hypothetical protein A7315_02770 [Candidatus Altiarchaeales archaeon WOR_SM1_79]
MRKTKTGKSQVALVKCADYEQENINCAVKQSIDLLGGMKQYIKPGDRVLLKVNLLRAKEGVNTHPGIVKAAIKQVKEAGGVPVVADTPAIVHNGDAAALAMVESGLEAAARESGVEAFLFETRGFVEVPAPAGKKPYSLHVAKTALDADIIISMPKLKTHGLTLFTGAVKNMFGVVPPRTRRDLHAQGTEGFSEALVDIYSLIRPTLTIMDGVVGMEGDGPAHGDLKHAGVILASDDGVALDAVASRIIGFKPMEIHTTRIAADRGIGNGDMSNIKVLGEKVEDMEIKFKRPPSWQSNIPSWLMGTLNRFLYARPRINMEKCVRCGTCEEGCPVGALRLDPYPTIDREKCIECYCCHEICPDGAVILERSWLARIAARR